MAAIRTLRAVAFFQNNATKNMIVHIKTPIVLTKDVSAAQTSKKRAPIIIPIA